MFEVDEAAKIITESVDPDANIIFGATIREDYEGELKITVVAAGFDEGTNKKYSEEAIASLETIIECREAFIPTKFFNNDENTRTYTYHWHQTYAQDGQDQPKNPMNFHIEAKCKAIDTIAE